MKPQVLLISGLYDFSTDLIALKLQHAEVPFIRINKEQVMNHRVSLQPASGMVRVSFDSVGEYDLSDVKSVWFRYPVFLRNTPAVPLSPQEQLEKSQWSAFMRNLSILPKAIWMNWPQATYLAENKAYQLHVASRVGFKIPKTIITNDIEEIKASFQGEFMLKPLDTVFLREGGEALFPYSTPLTAGHLSEANLRSVPVTAQEYLNPKVDYRVTIIGEELFAAKILRDGEPIPGDWREHQTEDLAYTTCPLPSETEQACFSLMRELGLNFGAIDLAETYDGFNFLEINPTGEWGWLVSSDRPLDEAISNWLTTS